MPGRLPFLSLLLCACANVILFLEYAGIVIAIGDSLSPFAIFNLCMNIGCASG